MRQYRARKEPEPAHVGVECLVPLFFRNLFSASSAENSGIVEQDIDSTKGFHCLFNHAFNPGWLRYIGGYGQRRTSCLTSYFFDPVFAAANQDNVGALADQGERARAANAAAGAGDDGYFVL